MICSALNSICACNGVVCGIAAISARNPGNNRTGSAALLPLGGEFVGVELLRRQRGAQQRRRAEADVAGARQSQRAVFRAVGGLDLLQPRGGRIGLDLGGDPPGHDGNIAVGLEAGGSRQHQRTLEARRASLERQHAVEIGRQCPRRRDRC